MLASDDPCKESPRYMEEREDERELPEFPPHEDMDESRLYSSKSGSPMSLQFQGWCSVCKRERGGEGDG